MHAYLLAGAYLSLACWLCVNAGMALAVRFWGRVKGGYVLVSIMLAVACTEAIGQGIVQIYAYDMAPVRLQWLVSVVWSLPVVVATMILHVALTFHRVKHSVRWMLPVYVLAALLAVVALSGDCYVPGSLNAYRLAFLGLEFTHVHAAYTWIGYVYVLVVPFLNIVSYSIVGLAYLRGRTAAFPVFLGAGLLVLVTASDALVRLEIIRGPQLLPLGMVFFSAMVALAFLFRYMAVSHDLSRQTRSLNERTEQLRKSRRLLRHLQSELGRTQQLAAVGEMAAVIAHEVRNPLAVITNAIASLRREGLPRDNYETLLSILEEESLRLNRLVGHLLSYTRPINLQRQRVILHDLTQRAMVMSPHREANIVYEPTNVRGQIWADPDLLRQVFDNVIENAVQATGGKGKVTIELAPMRRDSHDGFLVTFTDDGEGMDTQVRNRAKDPFFTTRPSGTGLGLAIVTRIVEAHRGDIWFENLDDQGTRVNLFLPIGAETELSPSVRRQLDTTPTEVDDSNAPSALG